MAPTEKWGVPLPELLLQIAGFLKMARVTGRLARVLHRESFELEDKIGEALVAKEPPAVRAG